MRWRDIGPGAIRVSSPSWVTSSASIFFRCHGNRREVAIDYQGCGQGLPEAWQLDRAARRDPAGSAQTLPAVPHHSGPPVPSAPGAASNPTGSLCSWREHGHPGAPEGSTTVGAVPVRYPASHQPGHLSPKGDSPPETRCGLLCSSQPGGVQPQMLVEKSSRHRPGPLAAWPVPPAEQKDAPSPGWLIREWHMLASLATGSPWAV